MRKIDEFIENSDKIYSRRNNNPNNPKKKTQNCFDKTGMSSEIYLLSIQNIPKQNRAVKLGPGYERAQEVLCGYD